MAYIGKQPVVGNFVKLDAITTSATATYNLLNGGVAYFPQTANNCIVSLNGVIQSPTSAYTISGSTIVFSDALTASDSIDFILVLGDVLNIGTPSDGTVGFSKVTSNLITGATAETSIAGGDSILIYDDSATALRKMTRTNFVSGIGGTNTPYFQAKITSNQSPADNTATKVNYDNEILDSGSYYNTSDKRFTPLVAGKYMIHAEAFLSSNGSSNLVDGRLSIYKNGAEVNRSDSFFASSNHDSISFTVQAIVDLNGSTDYVEIYALINCSNNTGMSIVSSSTRSVFQGFKLVE